MSSNSDFRGEYLRRLPAVGKLMEHPKLKAVLENCPRVLLVRAVQNILEAYKTTILSARDEEQVSGLDFSIEHIVEEVSALAVQKARMSLRRAINATGDVLNESLGRAPMNESAQQALQDVARGYSTLTAEADPNVRWDSTPKVDRDTHVQELLSILAGAEAGLVVNNNAAAVMLILNSIASEKEVIVSRGQLIESDGFRLPDIIEISGAKMVPVGTTNKTHLRDYRDAITENTGVIFRAHKSNYRIVGFSEDVPIQELAKLGKKHKIPVIDDIGGGCLADLTEYGFPEEPAVYLSIRSGADIVCFSGDKLLSGPQAGIVVGGMKHLSMMKGNPLYRVLRAGKLTIAALEATLRTHLGADRILEVNPALRMITKPLEEIETIARILADSLTERLSNLASVGIEDGYSHVPEKLPTKLVFINPAKVSADVLGKKLRSRAVPVFAQVREGHLLIDPRTVLRDEVDEIVSAVVGCCQAC